MDRSIIPPGDSALLKLSLESRTYSSRVVKLPRIVIQRDTSTFTYYIRLAMNVTSRPDSLSPLVVQPYKLNISQYDAVVRDQLSFTLENVTDQAVTVIPVAVPDNLLSLVIPESIEPASSGSGSIELTTLGVQSQFQESITIELPSSDRMRYTIPVVRTILDSTSPPPETACAEADSGVYW